MLITGCRSTLGTVVPPCWSKGRLGPGVGAVLTLSGSGYVFPRVAGTSAGAIVAALVAAHQVAGKPLSNIETIMASVDYNKFQDEAV